MFLTMDYYSLIIIVIIIAIVIIIIIVIIAIIIILDAKHLILLTSLARRVTVRVPATTANMGPGFDCAGMARGGAGWR